MIVKIYCGNQWFVCSSSRELRFCLYVSSLHNCEIQHQAALPCSGTMLCCSKLPTPAGSPLCNSGCCCCRCCTKNNWHLAIVGDTAQLRWAAPFRGIWKDLPRPDLKLKSTIREVFDVITQMLDVWQLCCRMWSVFCWNQIKCSPPARVLLTALLGAGRVQADRIGALLLQQSRGY